MDFGCGCRCMIIFSQKRLYGISELLVKDTKYEYYSSVNMDTSARYLRSIFILTTFLLLYFT